MKAVIFDMDGVILDSEPFWQQAEVEVFNHHGIPVTYEMAASTMGWRIDLVASHWLERYESKATVEQLANEILARVGELVSKKGEALPGLANAIECIQKHQIPLGLATSSAMRLAELVLNRLGLTDAFDAVFSAEQLEFGKPHPQVYLDCASALGSAPEHCVAIEDSVTGLISAKSARMKAIAIPAAEFAQKPGYGIADLKLSSLSEITDEVLIELGFRF